MNRREFFQRIASLMATASMLPAIELLPEAPTMLERQERYVERLGKYDFVINAFQVAALHSDGLCEMSLRAISLAAMYPWRVEIEACIKIQTIDDLALRGLRNSWEAGTPVTLDWSGDPNGFRLGGVKLDSVEIIQRRELIEVTRFGDGFRSFM